MLVLLFSVKSTAKIYSEIFILKIEQCVTHVCGAIAWVSRPMRESGQTCLKCQIHCTTSTFGLTWWSGQFSADSIQASYFKHLLGTNNFKIILSINISLPAKWDGFKENHKIFLLQSSMDRSELSNSPILKIFWDKIKCYLSTPHIFT